VETIARFGKPPRILSPANGQVYAIRPGGDVNGVISLRAETDADATRIYWFAGKAFLGSSAPRDAFHWRPAPGAYHIVALDDRGRSGSSSMTLQSVAE
jgi:penicillin-binding protein 1C